MFNDSFSVTASSDPHVRYHGAIYKLYGIFVVVIVVVGFFFSVYFYILLGRVMSKI